MNPTQGAVRQVLMNELGFTRESIREEMRKIVAQELAKKLNDQDMKERIDRAVNAEFKQRFGNSYHIHSTLKDIIREAVADKLLEGLSIQVFQKTPQETPNESSLTA